MGDGDLGQTQSPDVRVANNILNLEAGVECVLIGTLYKHMQLKPSALAEYAQEVCWVLGSKGQCPVACYRLAIVCAHQRPWSSCGPYCCIACR
jgi:hypothetical protein